MKHTNTNKKQPLVLLFPIIFAIGFVPLIVHMYVYDTGLSQFDWYSSMSEPRVDLFMSWKMIAIIVLGGLMTVIMLFQYFHTKKGPEFSNIFYLLMFYGIFAVMSALFSPYKRWVVKGTFELMEPVWVILAYIVLCFYTFQAVQKEEQIVRVLKFSFVGITIVLLSGILQFVGLDPFQMKAVKMLVTNPAVWDELDKFRVTVADRTCYMTLYNQNYVAFYVGLILPVTLVFLMTEKAKTKKLIWSVLAIAELICLYGSDSSSGWMALVIAAVIIAVILLSRNRKSLIIGYSALAAGLIVCVIALFATDIGTSIRTTLFGTYKMQEKYLVQGIDTGNDEIVFDCKGNGLHISYEMNEENGVYEISVTDDKGTGLTATQDPEDITISKYSDPRFGDFSVMILDQGDTMPLILTVEIDGCSWQFTKNDDGYCYQNPAGKYIKFPNNSICELFNEDAVSGRGHIWNSTLPLIGKHLLIGSGANTFMLEYPQEDYIYRTYLGTKNTYDVKAHNWYLQQAVENGLLGTLLLVAFYLYYFVQSVRIYRRVDLKERLNLLGLGIFSGTLIYMITAIANDPTVNVASMYWAFLGLGIAVNQLIMKQEKIIFSERKLVTEGTIPDQCPEPDKSNIDMESSSNTVQTNVSSPSETIGSKKKNRKKRKRS